MRFIPRSLPGKILLGLGGLFIVLVAIDSATQPPTPAPAAAASHQPTAAPPSPAKAKATHTTPETCSGKVLAWRRANAAHVGALSAAITRLQDDTGNSYQADIQSGVMPSNAAAIRRDASRLTHAIKKISGAPRCAGKLQSDVALASGDLYLAATFTTNAMTQLANGDQLTADENVDLAAGMFQHGGEKLNAVSTDLTAYK